VSASQTLRAARAAGIQIEVEGGDLLLEAPAPPPTAVLDGLSRHKAEIVRYCARSKMAGRSKTGGCTSKSGQQSPSMTVDYCALKPRLKHSSAASSNGWN
jgi:hypothetical protein